MLSVVLSVRSAERTTRAANAACIVAASGF
jgi:hypothetical protein